MITTIDALFRIFSDQFAGLEILQKIEASGVFFNHQVGALFFAHTAQGLSRGIGQRRFLRLGLFWGG